MFVKNKEALIKNCLDPTDCEARRLALSVVESVLEHANPENAIKSTIKLVDEKLAVAGATFNLLDFDKIYVLGAGKAGGGMAQGIEGILGNRIFKGFVNIPNGTKERYNTSKIELNETSHPLPDESGIKGANKIMELADSANSNDLVIVLISGGASSLLPHPSHGFSLFDLQKVTSSLLKSGADINELNSVRKHLSAIKGGRLAEKCHPATVIALIISDVVGDTLDVIASGPTVPDKSTYHDALNVLTSYGLSEEFPRVIKHFNTGAEGEIPETLKEDDPIFESVYNFLISTNKSVLSQVKEEMSKDSSVKIFSTDLTGEARDIGKDFGKRLMELKDEKTGTKPLIVIAGGETTVTVRGTGIGGRNQELILGGLPTLSGSGIAFASFGTDGIDGLSDAAGAIVDGSSLKRAVEMGMSIEKTLKDNDSSTFFKDLKDQIFTGPTGTNVNDVIVMVIL